MYIIRKEEKDRISICSLKNGRIKIFVFMVTYEERRNKDNRDKAGLL